MRPLVLAALLAASSSSAAEIAVEHTPLACVPADRYLRVSARAPAAAAVQLQFRSDASGPWYSTPMSEVDGEWTAFLPRPARTLARLEYRIVATGTGGPGATPPAAPRLAAAGQTCDAVAQVSVETPIVVTVPPGAPVVPPVPAGFSPAGVVAAKERPRSNLALKIAGGVVVAGVAAAALGGAAEATNNPPPTEVRVPDIRFNDIEPPPGSTLAPNRDRVVVLMRLGTRPTTSLFFVWRVELISDAAGAACLFMTGTASAVETIDLPLTGPLISTGACGPPAQRFDTERIRIAISVLERPVYEETLALPYHFTP
jgi:hypothetical protein